MSTKGRRIVEFVGEMLFKNGGNDMPWMAEYVCSNDHRTEHLHMGSREDSPRMIACSMCSAPASMVVSGTLPIVIKRGNGDFKDRERERLEKRSQDHWKRQGRRDAVERAISKGHYVPPQWIREEASRTK